MPRIYASGNTCFLRRKFDGNVLKTWYDSAENAATETRVNVMYPLTETCDCRHVSATVLCVYVKFPFNHKYTWRYESRVSRHFVIFLNFPCLITCLPCCLLVFENPNCPDCVGWSKEQCSFATRDCCLTDRADLTVGPTLSSEKSGRVF